MLNFSKILYPFLLFIFSVYVNNYYGSIGVFPIDSFAFFDSAYSINNGMIPFKDYWVMNGLIIDLIQSLFFNFLGTSWETYLLHSSMVNAIFALTTYFFFTKLGLKKYKSLFYSILVSILTYPGVGVPFPDHHSIIFSIIGFYVLYFATLSEKFIYWFVLPLPFFIAFFSKQVPAAYFIIVLSVFLFYYFTEKNRTKQLIALLTSCFVLIVASIFYLKFNQIGIKDFIYQYFLFPQTIGQHRINNVDLNFYLFKFINDFKFIFLSLFISIAVVIKKYISRDIKLNKKNIFNYILFLCIIFISIHHQILTKNQNFIFFLIPMILGVTHATIADKKKKYKFLIFFLLILSLVVTIKYHLRFNIDRKFMELENLDKTNFQRGEMISKNLKGLKWITAEFNNNPGEEIKLLISTINYLKKTVLNKVIITEYQFILAEIEHKTYSPNRWYTTDGVSYPVKNNKYFNYYNEFYKSALAKNKVETIFTIMPLNVKNFEFIFKKNCIKTLEINKILSKHDIKDCFK
jgi:hypothetical protein